LTLIVILLLFTLGFTIFDGLLCIEMRTWTISFPAKLSRPTLETEIRFVHQWLKRLIPFLPPSNSVVVVGRWWSASVAGNSVELEQGSHIDFWLLAGELTLHHCDWQNRSGG
jgi:hypothetical protein